MVSAYALTFGGFLLLGGRIGDLLGRRKVFMFGLALFATDSLLCGLSDVVRNADRGARAPGSGRRDAVAVGLLDRSR